MFLLDIAIVLFSFLFVAKLRSGTRVIISVYWRSLIPFTLIWIGSGIWGLKYSIKTIASGAELLKRLLKCDAAAIMLLLIVMYVFGKFHYSRYIVLGTILGVVVLELFIFIGLYYALRFHKENKTFAATGLYTRSKEMENLQSPKFYLDEPLQIPVISNEAYIPPFSKAIPEDSIMVPIFQTYLKDHRNLLDFINDYVDLSRFSKAKTLVLNSETYFNIENEAAESKALFINLHKINDFRRLNAYFIRANEMLSLGGVFICRGQTITERKQGFYNHFTPYLGRVVYFMDFLFCRVMPKLPVLQGWYFALTKGRGRALSETEILGRFYFCGFDLIHKREIDGTMHFILRKSREPRADANPTYGPLIRLKRKGLNGKTIYVKKFRTMHPYSEYLQAYVHATNDLQEGGKFKDDFRITSWGKVMRKLWIDELPQFLNFFAGELTLVGVRALSEHYFSLYPPDMQELRLRVKPGLLPPFYADMPKTFEEIVESERRYLVQKMEHPIRTDWRYFWKSVWNIFIKRARSN
jgi:lipopolysaccharide/colanic/teichoic acid biosynthesis glycosyltransferase